MVFNGVSLKNSLYWIAGLSALELVSWLTYVYPAARGPVTLIVLVGLFCLSGYRLRWGVYASIAELVIGSQGYILALPLPGFTLSLRLGIFLVLILATLIDCIRQRRVYFFQTWLWKWYVALMTWIGIGVVVGLFHGNAPSAIFFDANGYLFLAMIWPFTQSIRERQHVAQIVTILLAGVIVLALQTIMIVFIFSHQIFFQYYVSDLYRWIRDFRLGEITRQENGFYRVFFQSHIYVLWLLILSIVGFIHRQRSMLWFTMMSVMLLWLSYSRSFWVATVIVVGALWLYLHRFEKLPWRRVLQSVLTILGSAVLTYGFIVVLINMPIGNDHGSRVGAASLLTERTDDLLTDAAGGSRLALLGPLLKKNMTYPLLGGGLGTTVTYATHDPRALASNPSGLYTTFAFEWGYLDLWLKLGFIGTLTYLIMIGLILGRCLYLKQRLINPDEQQIIWWVGFGTIALVVVHALTPYLNHPLGIGWVLFATVVSDLYGRAH